MDYVTREEFFKELAVIKDRLNDVDRKLSDFTDMRNAQRASDIDFIAMETGVELEQEDDNGNSKNVNKKRNNNKRIQEIYYNFAV